MFCTKQKAICSYIPSYNRLKKNQVVSSPYICPNATLNIYAAYSPQAVRQMIIARTAILKSCSERACFFFFLFFLAEDFRNDIGQPLYDLALYLLFRDEPDFLTPTVERVVPVVAHYEITAFRYSHRVFVTAFI